MKQSLVRHFMQLQAVMSGTAELLLVTEPNVAEVQASTKRLGNYKLPGS